MAKSKPYKLVRSWYDAGDGETAVAQGNPKAAFLICGRNCAPDENIEEKYELVDKDKALQKKDPVSTEIKIPDMADTIGKKPEKKEAQVPEDKNHKGDGDKADQTEEEKAEAEKKEAKEKATADKKAADEKDAADKKVGKKGTGKKEGGGLLSKIKSAVGGK